MTHWQQDKDEWLRAEQERYDRRYDRQEPPNLQRPVWEAIGWLVLAGVGYVLAVLGLS